MKRKQDETIFVRKACKAMWEQMEEWQHYPSNQAKQALTDIVAHIYALSLGTVGPQAHICPLDCGVGKTTALQFAIKQLLKEGFDQGILLLFFKIDEARDFRDELLKFLGADAVALITSEDKDADYQRKPVLIITQQRFCNQLTTQHYTDAELFKVIDDQGNKVSRQIRVWDEALRPAVAYTLTTHDLMKVAVAVGDYDEVMMQRILSFRERVKHDIQRSSKDYINIKIPDWGVQEWQLEDINDDIRNNFLSVQGREMSGSIQDPSGKASEVLMTYKVDVPSSSGIFPLLVLDASYKVNKVAYDEMSTSLPVCNRLVGGRYIKRYENLSIHHINTSTSKAVFGGYTDKDKDKREHVMAAIADNLKLSKGRSLIICGKKTQVSIEKNLTIPRGIEPPRYLTWGRHAATNEFEHYDNIIIAGLYFKPIFASVGQLRAYKQLPLDSQLDQEELDRFITGDLWDCVYQAALRGQARKLVGDSCRPMTLTVLGAKQHRHSKWTEMFATLFPGATVIEKALCPVGNLGKFMTLAQAFNKSEETQVLLTDDVLAQVGLTFSQVQELFKKRKANAERREAALNQLIQLCVVYKPGKGRGRPSLLRAFN